jgi:hypothetical protein
MRDWNEINSLIPVAKYRIAKTGILRHTMLYDRGFRPTGWEYKMAEDKERWLFQAFFDLFCARNFLYGMEFDRPLLERLRATAVELGDPLLDGAWATTEGRRDAAGGAALGGENDRLIAEPGAFVAEGFGPPLEFVEGQVIVDVQGEAPGVI